MEEKVLRSQESKRSMAKKKKDWISSIAILVFLGGIVYVALKAFGIIDPPEILSWQTTLATLITLGSGFYYIGRKVGIIERNIENISDDVGEMKVDLKETKKQVHEIDVRLGKIE